MPGQHGNKRVGIQNVQIVRVMAEENLVLVKGGIPGPNGGIVQLAKASKAFAGG